MYQEAPEQSIIPGTPTDCSNPISNRDTNSVLTAPDSTPIPGEVKLATIVPVPTVEQRILDNILVEQGVLSAAEEQAVVDRARPVIGLLVGNLPSDGNSAVIKSLERMERDAECLLGQRRVIPKDDLIAINGRIIDEGNVILGYYYSECDNNDLFWVDHEDIIKKFERIECEARPLILRIRRILCSSVSINVEAGVRVELYTQKDGMKVTPIPFKIMDTAYKSVMAMKSLLTNNQIDFAEAAAQRTCLAKWKLSSELEYDAALSKLIKSAERQSQSLIWNVQYRLAIENAHIKTLIRSRMAEVEKLWNNHHSEREKTVDGELTELHNSLQRVSALLNQLVCKELPNSYADSLRKLPISNNLGFYDRPSIAMRVSKGNQVGNPGTTKKRPRSNQSKTKMITIPPPPPPPNNNNNTISKGIPRPILPASSVNGSGSNANSGGGSRSRTPSNDLTPSLVEVEGVIERRAKVALNVIESSFNPMSSTSTTNIISESLLLSAANLVETKLEDEQVNHPSTLAGPELDNLSPIVPSTN